MDGTYNDSNTMNFNTSNDGIDVAPVTVTAYSGKPIVDGGNTLNDGFNISGSSWYGGGNIIISNMIIRNYKHIFDIRYTQNIILDGLEIYGSSVVNSSGLGQITASRNITVNNSVFHDPVGYNGLEIIGQPLSSYNGQDTYYIKITNNDFYNNKIHAMLQIDEYVRNINIFGNHLWNNTIAGNSIAFIKQTNNAQAAKYFTIINNLMENDTASFQISESSNGLVENNTIKNVASYAMDIKGNDWPDIATLEDVTFRDITLINPGDPIWLVGGKNLLFERINSTGGTNTYDWYIHDSKGSITIKDEIEEEYTIILKDISNVNIEYSNNKVFKYTQLSGSADSTTLPIIYPDKSFFSQQRSSSGTNSLFNIQTYPMTATPASGSASVSVASFNTSLPSGSIVANFTADTANGNNVTFTVSTLKPNTNYLIKKGTANYTTVQADSTGKITFANSSWTASNFTVIETTGTSTSPSAPQILTSTASDGSVSLSWLAPASAGGSPITGYKVYRSTVSNSETFLANTSALSYIDSTVANYTTYYYQTTAINVIGESPKSNEATAIPQATRIQGTVSNSSGTPIQGATVQAGSNSTTTNSSGAYSLNVPDGAYTITVTASSSGYASQSKSAIVSTAQTTTVNFTLLPLLSADLNSDTYVNAQDFAILLSNWNSTLKPKADINQDGIVNSVDFGIMMAQWG